MEQCFNKWVPVLFVFVHMGGMIHIHSSSRPRQHKSGYCIVCKMLECIHVLSFMVVSYLAEALEVGTRV